MKTIKSKKSINDFEDLFYDDELDYEIKKKKKKKHKSSKKSSKKKNKKKIDKQEILLTPEYFGFDSKDDCKKVIKSNKKYEHKKSFFKRIADSVNVEANVDIQITDDLINNLALIASGIITKLITKNK